MNNATALHAADPAFLQVVPNHVNGGRQPQWQSTGIGGFVITYNEAANIEACLRSMRFCDELLVVDAHSTDNTREIARGCGARVITRDWAGYRSQREFAVDTLRSDWVFYLDADERASAALAAQIINLPRGHTPVAAYRIPFRTIYFKKRLRFGDSRCESHVRLFHRRRSQMGGFEIHEKVIAGGPVERLTGWVEHDSFRDIDHQAYKFNRYAKLAAEELYRVGKPSSWARVFVNPLWRFFRGFVLRGGFLDGSRRADRTSMATIGFPWLADSGLA